VQPEVGGGLGWALGGCREACAYWSIVLLGVPDYGIIKESTDTTSATTDLWSSRAAAASYGRDQVRAVLTITTRRLHMMHR
jgi:hypothetical protein